VEEAMTAAPTSNSLLTIDDVAGRHWDVLVIGAGPAGALSAQQAARAGLQTLLVEAKPWPRDKVCGCCLNQRAMAVLGQLGLASELRRCGGVEIDEMRLVVGGRSTRFALPRGLAISRSMLDAQLVQAAIHAGAKFLPETSAVVEPDIADNWRFVSIGRSDQSSRIAARVVVAADGLTRSSLKRMPEFATRAAPDSRVGVGAIVEHGSLEYPDGQIVMAVSRSGYVGLTRIEGGRLNIAAALDANLLQQSPSVGEAITSILLAAGLPVPANACQATWRGRPPLTSRPGRVAAERLLVIGDAGGYIEPFTGEGIAAAFESALAVSPQVTQGCLDWDASLATTWEREHQLLVHEQQMTCRVLAWTLRRPWSVSAALGVCRAFPPAANYLIRRINRPLEPLGRTEIGAT
jgi:flavin-dependent dehydrogenase